MSGAVDYAECPQNGGYYCRCGLCRICGNQKHTAVHGPLYQAGSGSPPYGHEYVAKPPSHRTARFGDEAP